MTAGGSAGRVEAVVFDWGGTLTPWHTVDLEEQWRTYAAHLHDEAHVVDRLAAALIEAEGAAWARARAEHTSARFEDIVASVGVDLQGERAEAALSAYRAFWEPHTWTDPQVRPLWEDLRDRGIRVGVLSNTIWPRSYHRGLFARDGVLDLVDADVYSSEIAQVKPAPEAFHRACAEVDVDPSRAVYVGDRLFEDIHGPHQAGMRAIWIPHSDLPSAQVVQVEDTPDAVAHELLDILAVVDGWNA